MVQYYYRNVYVVVFVYDVTKMFFFENMFGWIEECDRYNLNFEIFRILVGNKCDMIDKVVVNINLVQKFVDFYIMLLFEILVKDEEKVNYIDVIFLIFVYKLKNSKLMMFLFVGLGGYLNNVQVVIVGKFFEFRGLQKMSIEDK